MKKIIVILFSCLTIQLLAQVEINEEYNTLAINGEMKSISIVGEDRTNISLEELKNNIENAKYNIIPKGKKLILEILEPNLDFMIHVPKDINIIIEPEDIVFEGLFDIEKDVRKIVIKDIGGSIDVTTDGYEVILQGNSNDISVTSYLNISADSMQIRDGGSILMDSYWGDVSFRTIPPLDAMISMRAKQGLVELDGIIDITEEITRLTDNIAIVVGEGNADISLHSEKGGQVLLELEEIDLQMEAVDEEMRRVDEQLRELEFTDMTVVQSYNLNQNEPNPWKKSTTFTYVVPEDADVKFRFHDVEGNTIYEFSERGKKGLNKLKVNRKMIPQVGVIYYTMESGDFVKTRKMIRVD